MSPQMSDDDEYRKQEGQAKQVKRVHWSLNTSDSHEVDEDAGISWSEISSDSSFSSVGDCSDESIRIPWCIESSGDPATRNNTVEIRNFPPGISSRRLLNHVTVAGPFGKLYSIDVEYEWDGSRPATALLTFFEPESCRHFEAYVAYQAAQNRGQIAVASTSYALARQVMDGIAACRPRDPNTLKGSYGADPIDGVITTRMNYSDREPRLDINFEDLHGSPSLQI
ncbi:hypothetical protein V8F20_003430 [Naviculisporaceae sp. PSN 640]